MIRTRRPAIAGRPIAAGAPVATVSNMPKTIRPEHRRWYALALLCLCQFMVVLDFSIVNVALPQIQNGLGFSTAGLQWVISAFEIPFASFLIFGGRCADLLGRRALLFGGLVAFTLGNLLSALSTSPMHLIMSRALQGLGGAFVSPTALSLITVTFAEGHERNRALGYYSTVGALGFSAGMILGGVLVQLAGWAGVFYANVGFGLIALLLTPWQVRDTAHKAVVRHFDLGGALALTAGLTMFIFTISALPTWGAVAPMTLGSLVLALALLAGFVVIERRSQEPLMPLRYFHRRSLVAANLAGLMFSLTAAGEVLVMSLWLENVLHLSALQTGLAFLPQGILSMVIAHFVPGWVHAWGSKRFMTGGMAVVGLGIVLAAFLQPAQGYWPVIFPATLLIGSGVIVTVVAATITAVSGIRDEDQGVASGLLNTAIEIGAGIGAAVVAAVLALATPAHGSPGLGGYSAALIVMGALALLAAALLFWLTPARAAA